MKKMYWRTAILNGGLSLKEFGSDIVLRVPAEVYALFTDEELDQIRKEKESERKKIRELMDLLD